MHTLGISWIPEAEAKGSLTGQKEEVTCFVCRCDQKDQESKQESLAHEFHRVGWFQVPHAYTSFLPIPVWSSPSLSLFPSLKRWRVGSQLMLPGS